MTSALSEAASVATILGGLFSLITTVIAVRIYKVATQLRSTDWAKSQNDAWNLYNQQKLVPGVGEFFQTADRAFGDAEFDWANIDYKTTSVLYQRLNLLEKDMVGIRHGMLTPGDGCATVASFLYAGRHRAQLLQFMRDVGYDAGFIYVADRIMLLGARRPDLEPDQVPLLQIIREFQRVEDATKVGREVQRRTLMHDLRRWHAEAAAEDAKNPLPSMRRPL
jgi:hypothetical protein